MLFGFEQWAPDRPVFAQKLVRDARNVIPRAGGFGPFPSVATISDATTGARPRGLTAVRGGDGGVRRFAGDAAKLWRLQTGVAWSDVSKPGGYTATETTRWEFTTFGDQLIATNFNDAVQKIDISTGSQFADLAGSPPRARYAATYLDFVLLGHTNVSALEVIWSGVNNTSVWTSGVSQSDRQVLPDGGFVTGLAVTDAAYVFQEQTIRRMLYEGDASVMRFDVVERGRGCVEAATLAQLGRNMFYEAEDGFQNFNGLESMPIGYERVDGWWKANRVRAYAYRTSAAVDPLNKLVGWLFASVESPSGAPDTMLIYNYAIDRWAYAKIALEIAAPLLTVGSTLEDLDALAAPYGGIENFPISPDDPVLAGGALLFGGMTAEGRLASLAGAPLEATIETDDWPIGEGLIAFVTGVRPLVEARAFAAVGVRMNLRDAITWKPETLAHASTGICGARASGRYARAKVRVPAGASWTHLQGAEIDMQGAGLK